MEFQFHILFTLLLVTKIVTNLNLKGFFLVLPAAKSCEIWRLEERLPWFVCEAGGFSSDFFMEVMGVSKLTPAGTRHSKVKGLGFRFGL